MIDELNQSFFLFLNADKDASWAYVQTASFFAEAPQFILAMILVYAWLRDPARAWPVMVMIASSIAMAMVLSKIIGILHPVERPFVVGLGNQWLPHDTDPSFPSDHAALLFAIWGACVGRFGWRAIGWSALILGLVNGWARVTVGLHYPLDIVASLALGLLCGMTLRWSYSLLMRDDLRHLVRQLWSGKLQASKLFWARF